MLVMFLITLGLFNDTRKGLAIRITVPLALSAVTLPTPRTGGAGES